MYLNEATLLNNIRVRYSKDKIYVSTDRRKRHTKKMLKHFLFFCISSTILLFSPELELITGLRPKHLLLLLDDNRIKTIRCMKDFFVEIFDFQIIT